MARLSWENVTGPDFSGSAQGVKDAAAMINQALAGAQTGLARFEGIQDERANKDFAMDLLKYQDPEAYKTALTSGALFERPDARRISSEMINAAGSRLPTLFNQAKTEFEFGRDKRLDGQALAFDAAAPIITQVRTLMRNRDEVGAQKLIDSQPDLFKGMSARDVLAVDSGNAGALTDGWGLANTKQNFKQGEWRFNNEVTADNLRKTATAVMEDVISHAGDAQSAQAYFDGLDLTPEVRGAVRGMLGLTAFPTVEQDPLSGLIGGAGGGGTPGGLDPSRVMNYEARASGINVVPEDVKTLGQASDFALKVNAANKARTGENGSSAMGLYQIVGQTMRGVAPQVFGENWKNVPFTPENQDKLARKVFEQNRGSAAALKGQWTSLSAQDAERIRKMPWEQAREYIAAGESGAANVGQLLLGQVKDAAVRGVNAADQRGSLEANNNAVNFAKTQLDPTPIATVVQNLKKSTFPGASEDVLLARIQEVQARAQAQGVTLRPATAADILATSIKQRDAANKFKDFGKAIIDPFSIFTERGGLGGNTEVNYKKVDELIANNVPKKNPDGSSTSRNQDIVGSSQVITAQQQYGATAAAALQKAQSDLARAQTLNQQNNRRIDLRPYVEKVRRAQAIAQELSTALDPAPVPNTPAPVDWGPQPFVQKPAAPARKPAPADPGWSLRR